MYFAVGFGAKVRGGGHSQVCGTHPMSLLRASLIWTQHGRPLMQPDWLSRPCTWSRVASLCQITLCNWSLVCKCEPLLRPRRKFLVGRYILVTFTEMSDSWWTTHPCPWSILKNCAFYIKRFLYVSGTILTFKMSSVSINICSKSAMFHNARDFGWVLNHFIVVL